MLLDDRFVEAQRGDVVAQLSARHKEQSSHELHPAASSWVGALQSQAPRVALSSWGNGTALATEPPPRCCSHSLAAATECAPRCLNHCAVWLVHRSGSIAFSLFAVLLTPRRQYRLYIAEGPREPTLLRKRDWLAVAVVLLSLPSQIGQMEVCDLCKMRPAIPPCDVGNTS